MIELSRKKLLDLANSLNAIDVTHDQKECNGIRRWIKIAVSYGKFGINSKLFVDCETNTFYVIKARTSAIFMYN